MSQDDRFIDDVDDVELLLAPAVCKARRDEILAVVAERYHAPSSSILHYAGQPIA